MKKNNHKNVDKLSNSSGITLVALIVAIVVLLILASITIANITGNDAPAEKAAQAKNETEIQAEMEELQEENNSVPITDIDNLTPTKLDKRLYLWQGDITRLNADAIVNAANSQLLGCFIPCHGCIDNAIHSAAGLQLRYECYNIMTTQRHEEPTGQAKITRGYNLPAKHVIHTVGPIVSGAVTQRHREELGSCYRSCLEIADSEGLNSIAFCCISTGEFHFPNDEAVRIAVSIVKDFMTRAKNINHVIFNVFKNIDRDLYMKELAA